MAPQRYVPHLHFIRDYATNATYIQSIVRSILVCVCAYYNQQREQALDRKSMFSFYNVNSTNSLAELGQRLTCTRYNKTSVMSNIWTKPRKQETDNSNKNNITYSDKEEEDADNVAIICSYHSLPVEYVQGGDDYDVQCHRTTECVIEELGRQLHCDPRSCVLHVYQSKFGNSEWLTPFLTEAMECLPLPYCNNEENGYSINSNSTTNVAPTSTKDKERKQKIESSNVEPYHNKLGVHKSTAFNQKKEEFAKRAKNMYFARKRVTTCFVVAPGFATDCLETIEEIGQEAKELFMEHGGKHFSYIPALNHSDAHVETLLSVIEEETALQSKQKVLASQTIRGSFPSGKNVIVESGRETDYTVADGEKIQINDNEHSQIVNKTTSNKPQELQQEEL